MSSKRTSVHVPAGLLLFCSISFQLQNAPLEARPDRAGFDDFAAAYCVDCHNHEKTKGKFNLQALLEKDPLSELDAWDEVYWMLEDRAMPPDDEPDAPRPSASEYANMAEALNQYVESLTLANKASPGRQASEEKEDFIASYCTSCHNADDEKGGLILDGLSLQQAHLDPETWEPIVRRLQARQMPPPDRKRPDENAYRSVVASLENRLDAQAEVSPHPGRTDTFRRLTRTEYQNAVRDLLGVQIDASDLLPKDESSHGFDNITVNSLSPTLLNRYINAAQTVSRLALGSPLSVPESKIYRIRPDVTQEKQIEGLPLGTQGGALIQHTFPRDGTYEIKLRLSRDRNEHVEGLKQEHELDLILDRNLVKRFSVSPSRDGRRDDALIDEHLRIQTHITAGTHDLGIAFIEQPYSLLEPNESRIPLTTTFTVTPDYHPHSTRSPSPVLLIPRG